MDNIEAKPEVVAPEAAPASNQVVAPTSKDFLNAYRALCDTYGFQLVASPALVPTNHGTFEIGVRMTVALIEK